MAHSYDWPDGTGKGVGTCSLCGTTLRFVATGPFGGKKRKWQTADGAVKVQELGALDGEPPCIGGAVGPKPWASTELTYEALSVDHKRAIAELAWAARDIALHIPSARQLMAAQIKHLAFYWTTSAFCHARQAVIPDAVKLDTRFIRHTSAAHRLIDSPEGDARGVIHEHAVPRSILAKYVIEEATSIADVILTFNRHCIAVLVTEEEDKRLSAGGFRDRMPTGWTWSADPLMRYVALGIAVFEPKNDNACSCRA